MPQKRSYEGIFCFAVPILEICHFSGGVGGIEVISLAAVQGHLPEPAQFLYISASNIISRVWRF
jgi:hypothetical protein